MRSAAWVIGGLAMTLVPLCVGSALAQDETVEVRGQQVGPRVRLHGANLVQVEQLQGRKLTGIELDRARLTSGKFSGTDFTRASLKGADLGRATFEKAVFVGADLSGVQLDATSFVEANLERANLSGMNAHQGKFQRARMRRADLSGSALKTTSFENADLSYANFSSVKLEGSVFTNANLTGVEWGQHRPERLLVRQEEVRPRQPERHVQVSDRSSAERAP